MMRLRVFLAALLFAAAGLPDPVLGQAATPSRYMHPKGKFAILVPAGAEAVERDDGISLSIQSRKGYLINIQMGDANPSLDLSRMAVKLEAQYLGANKTWNRKLGERVITVGGLKAIDGTYEGERTRTRVIIARGRKTDFVIMFFAPPSKFDALVGEFDGILGTLAPGADEVVAAATAPRSESPPPPSPATKDPLQRYSDNDFRYAITIHRVVHGASRHAGLRRDGQRPDHSPAGNAGRRPRPGGGLALRSENPVGARHPGFGLLRGRALHL